MANTIRSVEQPRSAQASRTGILICSVSTSIVFPVLAHLALWLQVVFIGEAHCYQRQLQFGTSWGPPSRLPLRGPCRTLARVAGSSNSSWHGPSGQLAAQPLSWQPEVSQQSWCSVAGTVVATTSRVLTAWPLLPGGHAALHWFFLWHKPLPASHFPSLGQSLAQF